MYTHDSRQIGFHNEPLLFGGLPLKADNRWVKMAGLIPWLRVEDEYRKNFSGNRGEQAKSARLALGCLIVKEQKRLEREESGECNSIEGEFGEGKRRFSLELVMIKLRETSEPQIHLVFLVMNLQKILRDLFILFFSMRLFTKQSELITKIAL